MPPKPKFQDGEKVLCFHGPLMYEAKTVKCEVKEKTVRYFVHYNGWNKSWDEWVPESRVLKCNEAGLQKQKELKRAHEAKQKSNRAAAAKNKAKEKEKADSVEAEKDTPEAEKKPAGRRKEPKERSGTPTVEKKKGPPKDEDWEKGSTKSEEGSTASRKRSRAVKEKEKIVKEKEVPEKESKKEKVAEKEEDAPKKKRTKIPEPAVETEETFQTKIEVKIKIPDELKPWLVDDFDLITRQKQLVHTPCKNHVENILEEFIKSKAAKATILQKEAIQEVTQGIKDYFNVMLGSQLLYKFERAQYAEMLADYPDKPMSQIYGAVHLLRLFIRLGGMLAYTPLDEKSMHLLVSHLQDFLKYMSRNAHNLFSVTDYVVAPPEYHRKAL